MAAGMGWEKIGKPYERDGAEVRLHIKVPGNYSWACSQTRWESGFLKRSPNGARATGSGEMLRRHVSTRILTLMGLLCGAHLSAVSVKGHFITVALDHTTPEVTHLRSSSAQSVSRRRDQESSGFTPFLLPISNYHNFPKLGCAHMRYRP